MQTVLDLRSDTLTQPTPAMRQFMMLAPVGDSYYDEDPSVCALEERVASLFAMPSALFMPSGTLANQIALKLHCQPGDAVLSSHQNHIVQYESGALAALGGISQLTAPLKNDFMIDEVRLAQAIVPFEATHAPQTKVVAVENTHLRAGGRVYPLAELQLLSAECQRLGIALHMDGARIWHAHLAEQVPLSSYGPLLSTLSVCFSKGLGAPVGSCLLASTANIKKAKRLRKMHGGTMRQCGFLAAAATYALVHHLERLADDHQDAKALAQYLQKILPQAQVPEPETNIVFVLLPKNNSNNTGDAAHILAILESEHGLRLSALDAHTLRAVVHLDTPVQRYLALR